jgi:RNA polymerase sigma factor (sigma-70 family)
MNATTQSTIYPGLDSMLEGSRTNQAMELEPESDTVRFLRIYDEHMNYVYRYINFRVMNPSVAADLTSTVFEKALAAFESYRKEKAAPQTWLITIARNTVTDYLRQRSQRNTVSLELALEVKCNDPTPEEQLEKKEEREKLNICLSLLPTREQEIISLKFGAELNNRRIASVLRLSSYNVGTILFRAISKLRDCFFKERDHGKR